LLKFLFFYPVLVNKNLIVRLNIFSIDAIIMEDEIIDVNLKFSNLLLREDDMTWERCLRK